MPEVGMHPERLLEALLELAGRAHLEVRVLSASSGSADLAPTRSAACRVGERIWVVLAPDDPPREQAEILGQALRRYRTDFLDENFVAPGVREFLEQIDA